MSLTSLSHITVPSNASGNLEVVPLQQLNSALTDKADVIHAHTLAQITDAGTAAALNTGTTAGTIPVLGAGGLLATSMMPPVTTFERVPVADETERLALTSSQVQPGDMAIQASPASQWMLVGADPSVAGNWIRILSASDVTMVNGQVGVVTLTAANVGAIATADRGAANGVAALDAGSRVPMAQIPATVASTANMIVLRDAVGKAQVTTPVVSDPGDTIVTIDYVTNALAALDLAGGFVGTLITSATGQAKITTATTTNANITLHDVARTGDYDDLLNKPNLSTIFTGTYLTSATAQATVGTATTLNAANVTFHNIAKTGAWGDLLGKPTIQSSATTQAKVATATTFPNALVLHDVAFTGSYNDLLNQPTIPPAFVGTYVTSATGQATVGTASTLNAAIVFHNVAKTGSYNDLLNTPTIPDAFVGTLVTSATGQAVISTPTTLDAAVTLHNIARTGNYSDLIGAPAAFVGTYLTSAATQATVGTATTLNSASITFHNIAKTGSWGDLLNRPTLVTSATGQSKITTAAVIPSALVLHDVARTGDYVDLLNKPAIPTTYSGVITGNGALTNFTVTHNLGSQKLNVQVYRQDVSGPELVLIQTRNATINTTVLSFAIAPASTDSYDVNIVACD